MALGGNGELAYIIYTNGDRESTTSAEKLRGVAAAALS